MENDHNFVQHCKSRLFGKTKCQEAENLRKSSEHCRHSTLEIFIACFLIRFICEQTAQLDFKNQFFELENSYGNT